MNRGEHWELVYTTKRSDEVSWFQARPEVSLTWVQKAAADLSRGIIDAGIIDVGGGDARLVDELLVQGCSDVTVLDISAAALDRAKARLATRAADVGWITADITDFEPQRTWDVWHDRAVLHFLTDAGDQAAYRRALLAGLAPRGHVVLATFAPDGPTRCSGLEVVRYGPDDLGAFLGSDFTLRDGDVVHHTTPSGATQIFTYAHFQRHGS